MPTNDQSVNLGAATCGVREKYDRLPRGTMPLLNAALDLWSERNGYPKLQSVAERMTNECKVAKARQEAGE